MLTRLQIDGFKSFKTFTLELKPGLNVIVGPNGSGKTNIVRFLEFLANLSTGPLVEAVSRSGGAGAIFRQTPTGGLETKISIQIFGETQFRVRRADSVNPGIYEYQAEIEFSSESNLLLFSRQALRIEVPIVQEKRSSSQGRTQSTKTHVFDVEWTFDQQTKPSTKIRQLDDFYRESARFASQQRKKALEEFFESDVMNELKDQSMLLTFRHFTELVDMIWFDFVSGKSYNIDPNIVKQSEDIAGEPGIKSNGSGLAATLNAAKTASRSLGPRYYPRMYAPDVARYKKQLLDDLSRYSMLVNSDVVGVDVQSDSIENKLRVILKMHYDGGELKLPLSLASDGTVKWLALVAAILTNRSVIVVEEPENFLHPSMQREIVNIIRDSCDKPNTPTFAIITTHSETLVNSVAPEELVVVSMHGGATSAIRPENTKQLCEEISSTGFGLGYYLLAGAVE
jgi:predicted ATPase